VAGCQRCRHGDSWDLEPLDSIFCTLCLFLLRTRGVGRLVAAAIKASGRLSLAALRVTPGRHRGRRESGRSSPQSAAGPVLRSQFQAWKYVPAREPPPDFGPRGLATRSHGSRSTRRPPSGDGEEVPNHQSQPQENPTIRSPEVGAIYSTMREEAPHPSQPIRLAQEVAQSLLERFEIAGPVASMENCESDDTKR
jgi:hypothetical protein